MACLLTIGTVACGGSASQSGPNGHAAQPTPTPVPPLAAPWLIQVENQADARPQAGLSAADIVYEYETEGGISRFTALYFGTPSPTIGPVRSARLVSIRLLDAYKGALLYSGASEYVEQQIEADTSARKYNETTAQGALFRVNDKMAPHNLYTDGSHLAQLAQKAGAHNVPYQLWTRTPVTKLPPGGTPNAKFSVPVSDSENPVFTYDPGQGGYQRSEPDTGVLIDSDTNAPWEAKTIVVLPVAVTVGPEVEDESGAHGLDFAIVASGQGQVAVGGQVYPVTFKQSDAGRPQLTLANGQPAPVAQGNVLIELVKTGSAIQPA